MSPFDLILLVRTLSEAALRRLAQESSVPYRTLCQIRYSNTNNPTLATLQRLWVVLDGNDEYSQPAMKALKKTSCACGHWDCKDSRRAI